MLSILSFQQDSIVLLPKTQQRRKYIKLIFVYIIQAYRFFCDEIVEENILRVGENPTELMENPKVASPLGCVVSRL